MNNDEFKNILKEVGLSKKDFAKKVGLAYQTVAGWTNQGYPGWLDSYAGMMVELHKYKQHTLNDIYDEQKKQIKETGFISEDEMSATIERDERIEELFKRLDAIEKNQSK